MSRIENTILSHLVYNNEYTKKVLPYLKIEYFHSFDEAVLFKIIRSYVDKYNSLPTKESLYIDLSNLTGLSEQQYADVQTKIENLAIEKTDFQWLIDQTEKFCKDKAIYNCLRESIEIVDGNSKLDFGAIPELMQKALATSFDNHVGHDFIEDWEIRFDEYHKKLTRVEFDIEFFNKITRGGLPKKTFNVWLAPPHTGKSLLMCHCASANLLAGYNVLYISLEMGEIGDPSISQRIEANVLNIPLAEIQLLPKDTYKLKMEKLMSRTNSRLFVKEYPVATAGAHTFRGLLNELQLKKNFEPDIIYVDYMNLCVSSRLKYGSNVGPYTYVKAVGEELRGLAQEHELPLVTATQVNRSGFNNSELDMDDIAESFATSMTADFIAAITTNEQLSSMNQYAIRQIKNRYNSVDYYRSFVIGVDKSKMRLYDVDSSGQNLVEQRTIIDSPIMDNFGQKFSKDKFKGFK